MTRRWAIHLLLCAAALMLAGSVMAQGGARGPAGQGRGFRGAAQWGPNRGGRLMQVMYLERAWLAVSFELGATEEQLLKLRPMFQAAHESRSKAFEGLQGGDRAGLALRLSEISDQIRKDVDDALGQVLTEEQLQKWEEIKANPLGFGPFGMLGIGPQGPFLGGAAPQQ